MNRELLELMYGFFEDAMEEVKRLQSITVYATDDAGSPAADRAKKEAYMAEANRLQRLIDKYWEAHGG